MKKQHPESKLQQACVRYFRLQYPQYLIYANANGGKRSGFEAAIMQGEGVTPGIPDLTIVTDKCVIWIELKIQGGRLTDHQKQILLKLAKLSKPIHVCYCFEDFLQDIKLYI